MSRLSIPGRLIFALLCGLGMSGCDPISDSGQDEQKDPHFLTGKNRAQALDYQGAIESFEKALELNPRSASAHFELGVLNEQRANDYAAAIYHYDRFLRLRPDSAYAETVRQHVTGCKQELARSVSLAPVTQSLQRDFERLTAENLQLHQQVEQFQAMLDRRAAMVTNLAAIPSSPVTNVAASPPAQNNRLTRPPTAGSNSSPAATTRTHVIKSADTLHAIAQKYGVKLDALLAANPGVDAKRLKIGQTLTIPPH